MPYLELIRHAMTRGNLERRWTGTTDQPLCPEGIALARRCARPPERIPRRVWVSPLLRCRETAALLYPGARLLPDPRLRETAVGPFENRNHRELAGDPRYEEWIRSAGEAPVPGLESREEVAARAVPALRELLDRLAQEGEDGAVVTHGGVIMAVCQALGAPARDYYQWWAPCCGGWLLKLSGWPCAGRAQVVRSLEPPKEEEQ